MDARLEQAFVRVDVSDPHHDARVHQQLLDADVAAARDPVEKIRGKLRAEGLDAEPCEQRMARRVTTVPKNQAEAPRVAQPQRWVLAEDAEVYGYAFGLTAALSRQWNVTPFSRTKRNACSTRSGLTFFIRTGSHAWSTLCSANPWRARRRGPK